jgi:hypothetical protein
MGNLIYAWPVLIIPCVVIIVGLLQWARGAGVGPRQADQLKLKTMDQALFSPDGAWHRAPLMHKYFPWYPENDREWQAAFSLAEQLPASSLYMGIESLNEQRKRILAQNERIAERNRIGYQGYSPKAPRILPVATHSSH